MIDLSKTIKPKSDQLNADDLLTGPITIKVTAVKLLSEEQPVGLNYEGDQGKPYKPCKSMRRVLIALWGSDGSQYAGRYLTLYADPEVKFGGAKVGGIRISHMSHIQKEETLALTATKASRKPFTVRPLNIGQTQQNHSPEAGKKVDPQAPNLGQDGIPIFGGDGSVIRRVADADQYRQWFTTNVPKLDTLEKVEALHAKNIATFGDLNLKGYKEQIGDVKAIISEKKLSFQQPEEENENDQ